MEGGNDWGQMQCFCVGAMLKCHPFFWEVIVNAKTNRRILTIVRALLLQIVMLINIM